MTASLARKRSLQEVAEDAARDLVGVRHAGGSSFINLPLVYPSGDFVTVRLDAVKGGFRVSDNGFAYRELEAIGSERSFGKTASVAAEEREVEAWRRMIVIDTTLETLDRAICDIAMASWSVADRVFAKIHEEEPEFTDTLRERLLTLFGQPHLREETKIVGASSNEWDVTAIVDLDDHHAIFQAVSNHPNSIYRASTAFGDLAALETSPTLIAVVASKEALGPRLALLSREGRVIEEGQPDPVFLRAAA